MLQYITNTDCQTPVIDQVMAVIDGGCRWIQVRMKDASDDEIRTVVEAIKPRCIETQSFLILNDRVELAKKDMPCSQARMILGPAAVIGVTANTIEDIEKVKSLDIDYIGIGPFAHTTTKKRLAPVLGLEGIREICRQMNERGIELPHVAVGGIRLEDIDALLEAGVNGAAVSGAIANAPDIREATRLFIEKMPVGE